ncbi:MAG TPA: MMPL family transporter [Acidimicrobiales bacterium]
MTVVIAWLAGILVVGAASGVIGSGFKTQFSLPDSESADGIEILEQQFGESAGAFGGSIVVKAPQGVTQPEVQIPLERLFAEVDALDDVTVVSPYTERGRNQISDDGTITFATVDVASDYSTQNAIDLTNKVQDMLPTIPGAQIELGGQLFAEFAPPESETLGLAFAIIILIFAFGSVLAMGLPIGTALGGIVTGTSLVILLSNFLTMPEFTTTLGAMIGLGVGIDYALFIVTRYREGLHAGLSTEDSTAIAINTAGRAVLFAGTTVVISLLGMIVMGLAFVRGLAIGGATVVFMTMIASVTLLPALLGFAKHRVEVTRWRGIIAAGLVAIALVGVGLGINALMVGLPLALVVIVAGFFFGPLRRELPRRPPKQLEHTLPYRWSRVIQRFPWPAAIFGALVLVVLALPMLSLRLGFSDEGNFPEDTSTRKAYDLLAEGFGPGFNGPLLLVAEITDPAQADDLVAVTEQLAATEGVEQVNGPIPNALNPPTAVLWQVIPAAAPQDEATSELVHRLRDDVLPQVEQDSGLDVLVTGSVAGNIDFSDYLAKRLPYFYGAVLVLSFLLLMAVFRSLLVPLKAVIMNLLSIGAAYGVVVAIFQWGWLGDLIGIDGGPIEPWVPMMMFAIVFGLSMDYEVFLLSRVKEEWDRTGNNARAVADGLASTARVITAAAAIMVFVFGSFILEPDRQIKLFGIGLATAVLLDATIVRLLLVPATMELLGDRNWWMPRWLGRLIPKIDVEGTGHDTVDEIEDRVPVSAGRS